MADPAIIPKEVISQFTDRFALAGTSPLRCVHNEYIAGEFPMRTRCRHCILAFMFFTGYMHKRSFHPVTIKMDKHRPVHHRVYTSPSWERDVSRGMGLARLCKRYVPIRYILLHELGQDVGTLICQNVMAIVCDQTIEWLTQRVLSACTRGTVFNSLLRW